MDSVSQSNQLNDWGPAAGDLERWETRRRPADNTNNNNMHTPTPTLNESLVVKVDSGLC